MARLLSVLILIIGGWAAWVYVLNPALQPMIAGPAAATPLRSPTSSPSATPNPGERATTALFRAQDFSAAWMAGRYDVMYADLTPASRKSITRAAFSARYAGIMREATAGSVRVAPLPSTLVLNGGAGKVAMTVSLSTTVFGTVTYTTTLPLVEQAGGRWKLSWTPDVIVPGLGAAHRVHLFTTTAHRGAIVDRNGQPLAVQGDMLQLGVVPEYIHDENALLGFLSHLLGKTPVQIKALYGVSWAVAHPNDFVPVGSVSTVQWSAVQAQGLKQLENGLAYNTGASVRLYPHEGLAALLLGYVHTGADGKTHGVEGLEHWADSLLNGQDGARLAVTNSPDYSYIYSTLKQKPTVEGATLHLTLDTTLQDAAEKALGPHIGAVVALRPSDGAVLAMASTPGYDPNLFAQGISSAQYTALLDDPRHRFIDRASSGQYPLGSVFKIVSLGAALEKGGYAADTLIDGPGVWYGLGPNNPKHDWLSSGHGTITLHEALVQSCDTCFYQIGQHLDRIDKYLLPDYARAWGFGAPTGILGVSEAAGLMPDPRWTLRTLGRPWVPGDPVDLAIGQGYLEVTPLQAAQMLAAVGNGGHLYTPRLVDKITAAGGQTLETNAPKAVRAAPISAAHLRDIMSAMLGVTTESTGTAVDKFAGFTPSVAGKTGTAQATDANADAWFAALAPADHPRIALIVMVEHGGEGAAVAAPLARQILHAFFTAPADRALAGESSTGAPTRLNVP